MEQDNQQPDNHPAQDNSAGPILGSETSEDELEQCQKERDEYLNGWRRAAADFENYKKEDARKLEDARRFAKIELLKKFLPILDSLDRALTALPENDPSRTGLKLVHSQALDVLVKQGVERIEPSVGEEFDPGLHEAVSVVEGGEENSGKVVETVSAGYRYEKFSLRAAKVIVAK